MCGTLVVIDVTDNLFFYECLAISVLFRLGFQNGGVEEQSVLFEISNFQMASKEQMYMANSMVRSIEVVTN